MKNVPTSAIIRSWALGGKVGMTPAALAIQSGRARMALQTKPIAIIATRASRIRSTTP